MLPTLLALAALLLLPPTGDAPPTGGDDERPHGAHHAPRHASLFVGAADPAHHAVVALGADLEWRLSAPLGVAAFGDVALGAHPHGLVGAGAVLHPAAGLRVFGGPAVAISEGHRDLAGRVGLGYDLHLGRYSLTPTVNVDVTADAVTPTVGFGFGAGF